MTDDFRANARATGTVEVGGSATIDDPVPESDGSADLDRVA